MTRMIVPALVMTCCMVGFAQTPDTTKQTPTKGMKADAVTVTGCVAESAPAGHFMLNNATMSHDAMKGGTASSTSTPTTPGTPGTPGTPSSSAMSGDKMGTSYMLVGGDDLKAHVGHKVEVTGSLSMSGSNMNEKPATSATSTSAKELKVQSVKMVSSTCP